MALLLGALPAGAQEAAAVSVGLSFVDVNPTAANAGREDGPGLLVRLRGSQGVGATAGLGWFSSKVRTDVGGVHASLGRLNVKPVMGGVGYTRRAGDVEAGVALEAGYAFINLRATGEARQAYARRFGASGVSIRASSGFAWKANLSVWYDLGRNYGLRASVGYLGVRPRVTTSSSLGTTAQTLDLGSIVTSVGITYAVF